MPPPPKKPSEDLIELENRLEEELTFKYEKSVLAALGGNDTIAWDLLGSLADDYLQEREAYLVPKPVGERKPEEPVYSKRPIVAPCRGPRATTFEEVKSHASSVD